MRALRISSALLLAAACGASEPSEVASIGAEPVAVRACRLYDEPASACRGAPQDTTPLAAEAGGTVDRWLLIPKDGLILASRRQVEVGKQRWYEVALPAGAHGFVPAELAQPVPQVIEPFVIEPTLRILPENAE